MSASRPTLLSGALALTLLATSGYLTVELRNRADHPTTTASPLLAPAAHPAAASPATDAHRYERLSGPERTVVRDGAGAVLAVLTDKARTAVLAGPVRTFAEPATTTATLATDSWVRLLPQPWTAGAERETWFRTWFQQSLGSTTDDVLAIATQYMGGAAPEKDAKGVRYRGDASFGPINPDGSTARTSAWSRPTSSTTSASRTPSPTR